MQRIVFPAPWCTIGACIGGRQTLPNPYLHVWRVQRRHRRALEPVWTRLAFLLPLAALAVAGALVEPVLLAVDTWEMASGLYLRLAWLCCAAMSLRTYSILVRSPERAVLDAHPVEPRLLVKYLAVRSGWEGLPFLAGCVVLTWPVWAAGHADIAGAGALVITIGWAAGLLLGFPVHLASVWVAESPRLAGVLEAIRGDNPRLQAALIYAPGAVLALGGTVTWLGAQGVAAAVLGGPGAALLLVPAGFFGLAWGVTPLLARKWYLRTSLLLAEIDARYAGLEDSDEARWVYLQWMLRWMPAGARPTVLRELRHGWRGHRGWITGAWAMGGLAALGALGEQGTADRALVMASAGAVLVAAVGLRLAEGNPAWLEGWLDVPRRTVLLARGWVLACWLQALVLPPVLALGLAQGWETAWPLWAALEVLVVVLAALGAVCGSTGWVSYAPLALVAWAGIVSG